MTLLILGAALTLCILPTCWPCGCLILWLLRHRRIPVPCYRAARRAPSLQSTGHVKDHSRAKPDWVRQRASSTTAHAGVGLAAFAAQMRLDRAGLPDADDGPVWGACGDLLRQRGDVYKQAMENRLCLFVHSTSAQPPPLPVGQRGD